MFENLSLGDVAAWWDTVTPEFAFLLGLFFAVAVAGLAAEWVRRHRQDRSAPVPEPAATGRRRRARRAKLRPPAHEGRA